MSKDQYRRAIILMKNEDEGGDRVKQQRMRILYNFIFLLLFLIILYCLLLLKPFWKPLLSTVFLALLPFIIGAFIAFLLHPLVEKLAGYGLKRVYAILIIYLLFFGGAGCAIYLGYPLLIEQTRDFTEHLPELVGQYRQWTDELQHSASRWPDGMQTQIDKRINDFEQWLNKFLSKAITMLMGLINYLFIIAVIPFISFYLLKDIDQVKKAAWYITPKKWRTNAINFVAAVNISLGGYIRGQLLVCTIIGTVATLSFWLLGLQYPVLLGGIIAITNIIPYFGPLIGAVPVLVIALLTSINKAIVAVVIVFVLQFIEGNILSPYIMGKS